MKFQKSIPVLMSAALFCGLAASNNADAFHEDENLIHVGAILEAEKPAVLPSDPIDPIDSRLAVQNDIPLSFIIDPTIAELNDNIESRIATQNDVDSAKFYDVDSLLKVGDSIDTRTATEADVFFKVMLNSDIIDFDDLNFGGPGDPTYGHGIDRDSVIINMDDAAVGEKVFDRIATKTDTDAKVYDNGTVVALGDPVFAGRVVTYNPLDTDVHDLDNVPGLGDEDLVTLRLATGNEIVGDVLEGHYIVVAKFTSKNDYVATEVGEWVGERTADSDDIDKGVSIDGGITVVEEGETIPGRPATLADVRAAAILDPTEIAAGDLVYRSYATLADVKAGKVTGVKFVEIGDTIFSRNATQEDKDAGAKTGSRLVKLSELIPGAVVVTAEFLEANPDFQVDGADVTAGTVIYMAVEGKDAFGGSAFVPAVLATAEDVLDFAVADTVSFYRTIGGIPDEISDDEIEAGIQEFVSTMGGTLDAENKTKAFLQNVKLEALFISEYGIDALDALAISLTSDQLLDGIDLVSSVFAFSPHSEGFVALSNALENAVITGGTADILTRIRPDVSSGSAVAITGSSAVNATISDHQSNIVANSGKYLFADISDDSGVASGSSKLDTGAWGEVFISNSSMDMRDGVAGYDADANGFTVGADAVVSDNLTVGLALSYADIDIQGESVAESATDTDQYQGSLYGVVLMDNFFINGSVAYALSESDTSRKTFGGRANGSYSTDIYSVDLGVGMPVTNGTMLITPQVSMSYSSINPEDYIETGPGALNVSTEDTDLLVVKAGVNLNTTLKLAAGELMPKMRLIADWDVLREKPLSTSSWVSTGVKMAPVSGAKPAALGGTVGLGVDYVSDDGVYVLSLDYDMSLKSSFTSHAGSAKFRMNF